LFKNYALNSGSRFSGASSSSIFWQSYFYCNNLVNSYFVRGLNSNYRVAKSSFLNSLVSLASISGFNPNTSLIVSIYTDLNLKLNNLSRFFMCFNSFYVDSFRTQHYLTNLRLYLKLLTSRIKTIKLSDLPNYLNNFNKNLFAFQNYSSYLNKTSTFKYNYLLAKKLLSAVNNNRVESINTVNGRLLNSATYSTNFEFELLPLSLACANNTKLKFYNNAAKLVKFYFL